MNKNKLLLRVAGVLAFFICLGHTAGTFMPVPAAQVEVAKTAAIMKTTVVPMPIGKAQTYADIFLGNNLAVSLFLFISGLMFFFLSGAGALQGIGKKLLVLNSLGMLGLSVISALFFFPLPAACTGLAALLGLRAAKSE